MDRRRKSTCSLLRVTADDVVPTATVSSAFTRDHVSNMTRPAIESTPRAPSSFVDNCFFNLQNKIPNK